MQRTNQEEKIVAAILEEAKASGLAPTFVALVERIYSNQQELSRHFNALQQTREWERQQTEKRILELEEKVDPEKAAKRKENDIRGEKPL